MNFLCIYLAEKGGGALMHVYGHVWEHIVSLYYRTAQWMFTKLGRDEVLMARHMHKDVLDIFAQEADPGRGKIGHLGGVPSSKYSSVQKATATN